MFLRVYGEWHRPAPNEPLYPEGWGEVFRLLSGDESGEMHCALTLVYKPANIEKMIEDGDLIRASSRGFTSLVEAAVQKLMEAPEDTVKIDVLPQQVAAAAALSLHKAVEATLLNSGALIKQARHMTPMEILKKTYERTVKVELRFTLNPADWSIIKHAAEMPLETLSPRDGLMILKGRIDKITEAVNLLKTIR